MRRTLFSTGGLAVVLLVASSAPLFAQRTTGSVTGVVKDPSGAALPGVTVGVSGPNIVGTQTATTNEDGLYRVATLPPGEYQLPFTLSGFKSLPRRAVHVSVGEAVDDGVVLEVGQREE